MTDAYDVIDCGPDTSGRRILMNRRMVAAWSVIMADPRIDFVPTRVQGAYMARQGGGADASAGYHDYGGCLDIRTWDLTADQLNTFIYVAADVAGWIFWRRDLTAAHGGMDAHAHGVLLGDTDAASGALDQMAQFRAGLNGLSNRGPDYERRPDHVTEFDYAAYVQQEDDMQLTDKIPGTDDKTVGDALRAALKVQSGLSDFRQNTLARDKGLAADLDAMFTELESLGDAATPAQVRAITSRNRQRIQKALKAAAPAAE